MNDLFMTRDASQAVLSSDHIDSQYCSSLKAVEMAASAANISAYNLSLPGGIYTDGPYELPWNTYNYCSAPRVSREHYALPEASAQAELKHLIYIQRHEKRTPDNLVPGKENEFNPPAGWDCTDIEYTNYATGTRAASLAQAAQIDPRTSTPPWHPFLQRIWNGTCDSGTLTAGGLVNAFEHGQDWIGVYGPGGPAELVDAVSEETVRVRTSPEPRTFQVSGAFLKGAGYLENKHFPVEIQPSNIDSIVPSYSCAYANDLRAKIEEEESWQNHLGKISGTFDAVNEVLGTAKETGWNSWIDHAFDFLASRQCHGHPLPTNPHTGASIDQKTADNVYAAGDFEYNYIWNASPLSDDYVRYSFGAFILELVRNLSLIRDGKNAHKANLYIGHDGTMVRLLKSLAQSGTIRWPALGSEVIFEIWEKQTTIESDAAPKQYVRILAYGQVLTSEAKLLTGREGPALAEWTPIDDVITYLQDRIPSDLVARCNGS